MRLSREVDQLTSICVKWMCIVSINVEINDEECFVEYYHIHGKGAALIEKERQGILHLMTVLRRDQFCKCLKGQCARDLMHQKILQSQLATTRIDVLNSRWNIQIRKESQPPVEDHFYTCLIVGHPRSNGQGVSWSHRIHNNHFYDHPQPLAFIAPNLS